MLGAAGVDVPPPSDDGSDAEWESGRLRLFSQSMPGGWDVYGTTPPQYTGFLQTEKPDPLTIFDLSIGLKLRVTATSRDCVERWVYISFERPRWHFGSQYWMRGGATVEVLENEKRPSRS